MDEDKTPDTATETHQGEDATEAPATSAKPRYQIDLYQTARVHTERFVEDFDTREEAEAFAREQCESKGIDPDFEIEEVVVEAPTVPEKTEGESENSPEESDEKTTQENSLPVN